MDMQAIDMRAQSLPEPAGPDLERCQRELAAIIERHTGTDGLHRTAIDSLQFFRGSQPSAPVCAVVRSTLALIAQGAKRVVLADETYEYDQTRYLITSVDLPAVAQVTRASPEAPYLCFVLDLDPRQVGDLMSRMALPRPRAMAVDRGMAVAALSTALLDPVLRLARLLDAPADIPILAPLIEREILYRLLVGDQGMRLRSIALTDSQSHQIARAIDWLKKNFAAPLRIEELAHAVNMSTSSLHHNFKALTAMSPLQYQKHLRLQEARRLMLVEMHDAASAGHRVGYESPSQFSREYARLYGAPPLRDIAQLRQSVLR